MYSSFFMLASLSSIRDACALVLSPVRVIFALCVPLWIAHTCRSLFRGEVALSEVPFPAPDFRPEKLQKSGGLRPSRTGRGAFGVWSTPRGGVEAPAADQRGTEPQRGQMLLKVGDVHQLIGPRASGQSKRSENPRILA